MSTVSLKVIIGSSVELVQDTHVPLLITLTDAVNVIVEEVIVPPSTPVILNMMLPSAVLAIGTTVGTSTNVDALPLICHV